jgi:hypothetical protein
MMKKSNKDVKIDMNQFKELRVFTKDGMVSFDTKGLSQVEGYGTFVKNKIEKIITRIFNGEGVLKLADGRKIDLTMQVDAPQIIYKK